MPEYRYQARYATGEPIFGLREAASEEALQQQLEAEGLLDVRLLTAAANAPSAVQSSALPRLIQMRVGERLREALLLQLPAHEVVRAVAEEPFQHPLLMLWPLLMAASICGTGAMYVLTYLIPVFPGQGLTIAAAVMVLILIWGLLLREFAYRRPQRVLLRLAAELERGLLNLQDLRPLLPGPLRDISSNGLSESSQVRLLGELIPAVGRLRLQRYRLAAAFTRTIIPGLLLTCGMAVISLSVLPVINEATGKMVIESSTAWNLVLISLQAVVIGAVVVFALLLLATVLLCSGRLDGPGRRLPLIGRTLVWLTQASFCRVLATYLRQGLNSGSALHSAALVSGGAAIRAEAAVVAEQLEKGEKAPASSGPWLAGLPLGLLSQASGGSNRQQDCEDAAAAFDGLAAALESASLGHGRFAADILGLVLILSGGVLMIAGWLIVFAPMIRLLNLMMSVMVESLMGWLAVGGLLL